MILSINYFGLRFLLIEHRNNYSKTTEGYLQFCIDGPNAAIRDTESFKFKVRVTEEPRDDCNGKNFVIVVTFKYLRDYWRDLEVPVTNCEKNIRLTWSANFAIINSVGVVTFAITDTKLYVLVVTLSTKMN